MNLIGLPQAAQNRIWVLAIAAAVDLLIGDPHWMWHPVQGIGSLISFSEKSLRGLFRIPAGRTRAERNRHPEYKNGHPGRETGTGDTAFHVRERIAGMILTVIVLIVSTGTTVLLLRLCGRVHTAGRILAEGILCGRLLAQKSLSQAGIAVRDPLLEGNVEKARHEVSMIVGRDTEKLDPEGIAKAAVETVAENTSDGVTAPLFYAILLGGAGCVFYKAVNTMDSMVGYRNDRYRYFGTAAARLDDVMNYVPARLTALLMILSCLWPGRRERVRLTQKTQAPDVRPAPAPAGIPDAGPAPAAACNPESPGRPAPAPAGIPDTEPGYEEVSIPDAAAAFRIWRRDSRKSPSPNSAQTESVCAGALHLRLLGDTWYFGELHRKKEIGDGGRPVEPEDITRTIRLMNRTTALLYLIGFILLAGIAAGL